MLFAKWFADLAIKILDKYPDLARVKKNAKWRGVVESLAGSTLPYKSGKKFGLLENFICEGGLMEYILPFT